MKIFECLRRRCAWANLSTATLIALLQRTPVVQIAAAWDEFVAESPMGSLLKGAAVTLASLGAVNSIAGATVLATSITPDPSGSLPPLDVTVGTPITPVGFTITNTLNVGSWTVTGTLPPGLRLVAEENPEIFLTGPGNLDATTAGTTDPWSGTMTGGNPTTIPLLEGTPTTPGTYTFSLKGYAFGGEQGGGGTAGFVGTGVSAVFPYTVVVASNLPSPPSFTSEPISVSVTGGTVALAASATNGATYQWMLNGSAVSGATSSTLLITDASSAAGTYTCVATNAGGSVTSSPATVSLISPGNPGRLINISCRAQVGTGGDILIAGFVAGGSGTSGSLPVLIRGSGPALVPFDVTGTLSDPELNLFQSNSDGSSTLLASNSGWAGSTTISGTAASVGAFPWNDPTSHDAALVASVSGANTAQIVGESGDTGVALAEVYDATPSGSATAISPRLINISARVEVGTGGNVLIAGFVIGGSTAKTVLIRGSGPALDQFGLTGTLPDPELQLFRSNSDGSSTLLDSNDSWGGSTEISTTAADVGAFAWANPSSNDSALVVTLPPGAYTAEVSGASGDTGVALVEVYEVP